MESIKQLKNLSLGILVAILSACAPFYQRNIYGNGHYVSSGDEELDQGSVAGEITDYQAYQVNFMTISVDQVSYNMTSTYSYLTIKGTCFNPGFEKNSIYYKLFDQQGNFVASDGYPYATNMIYYHGTSKLQPVNITCGSNGLWQTTVEVPTATLQQLNQGFVQVAMVVWYQNQELHNEATGVSSASIQPPQPQNQNTEDNSLESISL